METATLRTKSCPLCGETIAAEAIKCRFCAEFLDRPAHEDHSTEKVLVRAGPSLLALIPAVLKAAAVVCGAVALAIWPVKDLAKPDILAVIERYRGAFSAGIVLAAAAIVTLKAIRLKTTSYEVTNQRIEHSRGILDRRIDNLDMFRVVDLKLRRSLLDCICGIGRVILITTDKTDPQFSFEKVRQCRHLYDVIKRASTEADRENRVVHLQ